jgi:hypothetical protein
MADVVTADPNIFFQAKTPDIFGSLANGIQNGMKMSEMATKNKQLNQQWSDDQTTRQAFSDNMVTGPDGKPTLDQQGVLSDLTGAGLGEKAMTLKNTWLTQGLQQKSALIDNTLKQHAAGAQLLGNINDDDPADVKQAKWTDGITQGTRLGLQGMDQLPKQYPGDSFKNGMIAQGQTATEHLTSQQKDIQLQIEQQKADNAKQELGIKRQQFGYTKQFEANQQVQGALESARQAPDAQQASKDLYSSGKVKEIMAQAPNGDLSKLSPMLTKILFQEGAKVATGGIPSESELKGITPNNISQKMAELYQMVANKPASNDAREFIGQMGDYVGGVAKQANDLLYKRENRIIEQRKNDLGDENYNNYKAGLAARYTPPTSNTMKDGSHPQDVQAVNWAKLNPKDPRSAAILKANGQ